MMYYPLLNQFEIRNYYDKVGKKPSIISLGEFAGFPNPITGNIKTYADLLKENLTKYIYPCQGFSKDQFYDFQSLFFQKSYFITSVLKQNPTVEELNRLLIHSVETTKSQSIPNNILVRERLKKRYQTTNHSTKTIHDILKTNSGTIVLRSSLSNDISYKIQENVFSVLGKKGRHHAVGVIQDRKDELIHEIIQDMMKSYHLIYALDPNACIIEMGITIPKIFYWLNKNEEMKTITTFLNCLIESLKVALRNEDVAYIDGRTVESTSLLNGQEILYYEILEKIYQKLQYPITCLQSNDVNQEFENNGLIGMMEQEEKYIKKYEKLYQETKNIIYYNLVREHSIARECYQKTIGTTPNNHY